MSAGVEIRTLSGVTDQTWDQYVRSHPDGSLFHEGAWLASVASAYKHPSILLQASSGGKVTGVLPLHHVKSMLFGSRMVSTAVEGSSARMPP